MMQSASRRALYVGVTSKLTRRVYEHKMHASRGYTEKYNAERLVWFEQFSDMRNAIDREKQIKNWRREKKNLLVQLQNPQWRDLSEGWFERHSFQPVQLSETEAPETQDSSTRSARSE
jgi:putative endonuclease